jgi:hypothetical protein
MIHFLTALALCYVEIKIPFWVLSSIRGAHGRSFAASMIRSFVIFKIVRSLRGGDRNQRSSSGRKPGPAPQPRRGRPNAGGEQG